MALYDNLSTFYGKEVVDYDPEEGINNLEKQVYRLRLDYDMFEDEKTIGELLEHYLADPKSAATDALVIGAWDFEASTDSSGIVETLVKHKDHLSGLRALFFGDIISEECEMSWIEQSDMNPILINFPRLEVFCVRGGNNLRLSNLSSANLKKLAVQTGGMNSDTFRDILGASLPSLNHLEIWLGTEEYGCTIESGDIKKLLLREDLPDLEYLGLKNSDSSDEIAQALSDAPIMKRVKTLDLSLGTLGDKGAEALMANPLIKELETLNLEHHFLTDAMMAKLNTLGIPNLNLEDQEGPDEDDDYRYVAVGE